MTKTEKIMSGTIAALLLVIFFLLYNHSTESTTTETKNVTVDIPAKSGSFLQPTTKEEIPSKGLDSIRQGSRILVVASKVDRETLSAYKKAANDSIAQLNVLLNATREREYLYRFENDTITISMTATAFGKVTGITPKYDIKKTSVSVPQTTITKVVTAPAKLKDVVSLNGHFGFLVGGSYQQDLQNRAAAYGVAAGIRVQKITVSATLNTNKQAGITALIEL